MLPGITRKSVIEMLKSWGVEVEERLVTLEEILEGIKNGDVEEAWCTGTAAVISPIGEFATEDETYPIGEFKSGPLALKLYHSLTDLQFGRSEDKFGWTVRVEMCIRDRPEQERSEGYLLIQVEGDTEAQIEDGYETVGKICLGCGAFEVFVAESRTDSAAMWNVRQNGLEGMRARDPHACASGDLMVPLSAVPEMIRRIREISAEWKIEIGIISHIGDGNIHPIPLKPAEMPRCV